MGRDLPREGSKTMTQREFFNAVINSDVNDEMKAFATKAIEKLNATNSKRKGYVSPKEKAEREQKAKRYEVIFGALTSEPKTASDIITELELDIKPQAVAAALKGYVADGKVEKVDVKVEGHKGTVKAYKLA